jgi:hypothetical protein
MRCGDCNIDHNSKSGVMTPATSKQHKPLPTAPAQMPAGG